MLPPSQRLGLLAQPRSEIAGDERDHEQQVDDFLGILDLETVDGGKKKKSASAMLTMQASVAGQSPHRVAATMTGTR